jgi:hypothetical protein
MELVLKFLWGIRCRAILCNFNSWYIVKKPNTNGTSEAMAETPDHLEVQDKRCSKSAISITVSRCEQPLWRCLCLSPLQKSPNVSGLGDEPSSLHSQECGQSWKPGDRVNRVILIMQIEMCSLTSTSARKDALFLSKQQLLLGGLICPTFVQQNSHCIWHKEETSVLPLNIRHLRPCVYHASLSRCSWFESR